MIVSNMRRRRYPTDRTDGEWTHLAPLLSSPEPRGRPREHPVREILDAIFYVVRGGCPWRMLPHDFPPWGTAYSWFRRWRLDGLWQRILVALRRATRRKEGRDVEPSAAVMDSQSVRVSEESGGTKGYDAGKNVPGRKRHVLVDLMPRLKLVWADGADAGEKLGKWCEEHTGWLLEIVPRGIGCSTFEVLPRRWLVEQSIACICRNRRLAKGYERKVQTSDGWLKVAMIRLMLKRLGRDG